MSEQDTFAKNLAKWDERKDRFYKFLKTDNGAELVRATVKANPLLSPAHHTNQ